MRLLLGCRAYDVIDGPFFQSHAVYALAKICDESCIKELSQWWPRTMTDLI